VTLYSSKDCGYLLVGICNLLGVSDKLDVEYAKDVVDTTALGMAARQYEQKGIADYSVSGHSGWYDDTALSINDAMVTYADGQHVFMFAHEGNAKGLHATCAGAAIKSSFKRSPQVGDFTRANMELAISGEMDEAVIVKALAAVSGNGNSEADYLDLGASGAGTKGANVYLDCTALGAGTTLTVTLEDSTDHISWADQTVMTPLTAAGAEKKSSADLTVNRYLAAKHAFAGGVTTATYTLAAFVKP
jgi:hypothetical protein